MKRLNCLYGVAAAVVISLQGAPTQAASVQEATVVRIVDGTARLGVTQSLRSDNAVDEAIARMRASRTQLNERFYLRTLKDAPFQPVGPITGHAPQTGKP
jgi:hypothetical protein